jgi:hypothetical protein
VVREDCRRELRQEVIGKVEVHIEPLETSKGFDLLLGKNHPSDDPTAHE